MNIGNVEITLMEDLAGNDKKIIELAIEYIKTKKEKTIINCFKRVSKEFVLNETNLIKNSELLYNEGYVEDAEGLLNGEGKYTEYLEIASTLYNLALLNTNKANIVAVLLLDFTDEVMYLNDLELQNINTYYDIKKIIKNNRLSYEEVLNIGENDKLIVDTAVALIKEHPTKTISECFFDVADRVKPGKGCLVMNSSILYLNDYINNAEKDINYVNKDATFLERLEGAFKYYIREVLSFNIEYILQTVLLDIGEECKVLELDIKCLLEENEFKKADSYNDLKIFLDNI